MRTASQMATLAAANGLSKAADEITDIATLLCFSSEECEALLAIRTELDTLFMRLIPNAPSKKKR